MIQEVLGFLAAAGRVEDVDVVVTD